MILAGFLFYTDKMLTGCCDRIQKNSRKDDSDVRKTARKKQQQALKSLRNGEKCEKSLNLRFFTQQICAAGITNLSLSQSQI